MSEGDARDQLLIDLIDDDVPADEVERLERVDALLREVAAGERSAGDRQW